MKKGVSTIIATILMLLIVIAIVGFAFGFFQRFFGIATAGGEEGLTSLQQQTSQAIRIENVGPPPAGSQWVISVRNVGGAPLDTSTIVVYKNGNVQTCDFSPSGYVIPPQEFYGCLLPPGIVCSPGDVIGVTTTGLPASWKC